MKIAVDAMGGDHGPAVVVEGALAAVREFASSVILVGDREAIEHEIRRLGAQSLGVEIRHASEIVGMAESPSMALLPSLSGFAVLIDAGANITPKPWHLFQFAIMGHVYARDILRMERPRVGLLSVGEEEGKGNDLTREAYELLKESKLNFIGNIEGRDVYNGNCDVIVTDGFTGNVALKISESLAEMVGAMIKEELTRDLRSKMGAALSVPAFGRFKKRVDYTEMGGAPLLGIDGAAIICHGASPVKAIKNAVRVAAEWAKAGLNEHIKAALEAEIARGGREGGRE